MASRSSSRHGALPFSPASPEAPVIGITVTPLQIRKNTQNTTAISPVSPSDVSPVTPAQSTSTRSMVAGLPSSKYSPLVAHSHSTTSSTSTRAPSKSSARPPDHEGLQVDYDGLQVVAGPPPPPPPPKDDVLFPADVTSQPPPRYPGEHQQFQPTGVNRMNTSGTSSTSRSLDFEKEIVPERQGPPQPKAPAPRFAFQRRLRLWILLGVVLLLVIIGIVVGAVVGSQKHSGNGIASSAVVLPSTTSAPLITPTAAPDVYDNALPGGALRVDTPLAAIQFTTNSSEKDAISGVQNFELYYNSHCGNTEQLQNTGSWAAGRAIFTDAINGSGLAGINYWNATRSMHETYLFYIGVDNMIRDKRLNNEDDTFEVGSLIAKKVQVNAAQASALVDNSTQKWNSYALAAAYSENMPGGSGARLFYHAQSGQKAFLQELIWSQANDSWSLGVTIDGALSTSHLSIVTDEANAVVRLMFASAGDDSNNPSAPPTLQEYYLPLNHADATWTKGQSRQSLLLHPSSQFALATGASQSLLYHVTTVNSSSPALQIRELTLPNANGTDAIDMSTAETVAVPDWLSTDTGGRVASLFAPISAIGGAGFMNVFFAHGTVDAQAGYTKLSTVSRPFGKGWDKGGAGDLPLDQKCAKPNV